MKQINRTLLLILLLILSDKVAAQEKRVTLKEDEILVAEAFARIEQQTGYSIAYSRSFTDSKKRVALSLENVSLNNALAQLLEGTGHTYKIKGYHIIVYAAQQALRPMPTQTIRGQVIDEASRQPIPYASISLPDKPRIGVAADSLGRFTLPPLPVGRYAIRASYMGYEPRIVDEIVLTSAKEVDLTVSLKENVFQLKEVTICPKGSKQNTVNPMALTGGRMLSVEEAQRFAGGFDDPARLVSSFAGVAGNVSSNAISVRGNSPQFSQWRIEGIEIPNPTHYPDITGLGGGLLTGLSTHTLDNSDFFNSAFPAEYSNALAGVFDMSLRTGNSQHYEHSFQIGTWGIDLASEGPISRKNQSSYLVNYRYSYSGLMDAISGADEGLDYQDLTFKLNFPTKRAGTFSIWGIGIFDKVLQKSKEERSQWEYISDRQQNDNRFGKAVLALGHQLPLKGDAYLKTTLALTHSNVRGIVDQMDTKGEFHRMADVKNSNTDVVLSSYLNKKLSGRHTNRTGITLTRLSYGVDLQSSEHAGVYEPMKQMAKGSGNDLATSAFTQSVFNIHAKLDASVGLTGQFFTLNRHWNLEPRASLKWKLPHQQSLALAYGWHSTRGRLDYYYIKTPETGEELVNKNLDFSKAHHLSLSYAVRLSESTRLKAEPYYQSLYDIPVDPNSPFSVLNYNGYVLNKRLVNEGKGRNYGIDLTVERHLSEGWYALFSGSLFKSEYRGSDKVWRNTRMDRRFIVNALAGKEWMVGRRKKNVFSANLRLSYQGGDCYTPIDLEKSQENQGIQVDESRAYSLRLPSAFTSDLTLRYRVNKKRVSHEVALMLLNMNGFKQTYYTFNLLTNTVEKKREAPMIFGISWKIYF